MNVFKEFGLSQELLETIEKKGITEPTKIQSDTIPLIIEGKDVIGESATGSGKTLAFGCGIIERVVPGQGLQALVLTPTRELAEQVKNELNLFSGSKHLNIITIYGGVGIGPQIHGLPKADVVVGTPGRLLDHLERGTLNLSKIMLLTLDEADRMLDMGFIDDVERIISQCPKERQTLFFSATISQTIRNLGNHHMHEYTEVKGVKMVDPSKLKQVYYDSPKNVKLSLLVHLLSKEESGLVMVFCNTRRTTDFVVSNLKTNKVDAVAIHGGFTQNKRSKMLDMFNGNKAHVLVCTDVAARGLHIDNVSHVYNYEIPPDSTDYVHRIGRTARAGEDGKVVNIICEYDYDNFSRIQSEHRDYTIEKLEMPQVERVFAKHPEPSGRGGFRGGSRGGFRGRSSGGSRGGSSGGFRGRSSSGSSSGFRGRSSGSSSGSSSGFRGRSSGSSSGGSSSGFRGRSSGGSSEGGSGPRRFGGRRRN